MSIFEKSLVRKSASEIESTHFYYGKYTQKMRDRKGRQNDETQIKVLHMQELKNKRGIEVKYERQIIKERNLERY